MLEQRADNDSFRQIGSGEPFGNDGLEEEEEEEEGEEGREEEWEDEGEWEPTFNNDIR